MRNIFVALVVVSASSVALAADRQNQQEEQREAAQLRAAQAEVQAAAAGLHSAQHAFTAARQKAEDAKSGLQKMSKLSHELHELLETRFAEKAGVTAAREAQQHAQLALESASQQPLTALKATPGYRAAVTDADSARERLKTLGPEATIDVKTSLSQATLKPGQLERAAVDADPAAKAAKEKATHAGEAVRAALDKLNQVVEKDPEFKKSQDVVAKSQSAYNTAKATAEREERAVAAAASKLASERAQLASLQRSQAADDARDRQEQMRRKNANNAKKKK